jgi:hypothetical protein
MELTADPAGYTEEVVRVGHTGEEAAGLDGHTEADLECTEADPGCTEADLECTEADPGCTEADPGCTEADPACAEADPGCTEVVQVVLAHIAAAGLVEQTAGDLELDLEGAAAWVSEPPPLLAVIFWALLPIN